MDGIDVVVFPGTNVEGEVLPSLPGYPPGWMFGLRVSYPGEPRKLPLFVSRGMYATKQEARDALHDELAALGFTPARGGDRADIIGVSA